jgi:hypothetical protein
MEMEALPVRGEGSEGSLLVALACSSPKLPDIARLAQQPTTAALKRAALAWEGLV